MTIFVDDMRMQARVGRINARWSHLYTDQDDQTELHEFARRLGLRRAWFQHEHKYPHAPWFWHYDVTDAVRTRAITLGATPIGMMEGGRMMHRRAADAHNDEVERQIHRWHDGSGIGLEVYEWLGWSWETYKAWGEDPTTIQPIPADAPCRTPERQPSHGLSLTIEDDD